MSLEYTPIEAIPKYVEELKTTFRSGKAESVQFRLNQLRNLYFALEDNLQAFCDALEKDFHRSPFETQMFEHYPAKGDLVDIMSNLTKWLKPVKPYSQPLVHAAANVTVERAPLGVCLIVVPFNYPLQTGLPPLFGAIAGGNCAIYKPSELLPHFSSLLAQVLTSVLDKDIIRIVQGGAEQMSVLLKQPLDLIFFTGSTKVGKIVAKAAAENLTPVVLELGGKSPAIVTKNHGNLDTVVNRILWGKFLNGGQTCVAVDYILCDEEVKFELIQTLKKNIETLFFPNVDKDTEYTHVVSDQSFKGLVSMLEDTEGEIITGGLGDIDPESRYIPPTVVSGVTFDDATMQREIFGPILPVLSYKDLDEALNDVVENHDFPLALYIYSDNSKEVDFIKSKIRSGAVSVNDNVTHVGLGSVPFGGVGTSGYGYYHGKYSVEAFTHIRTVYRQPLWAEFLLKLRYPPFGKYQEKLFALSWDPTPPFFGREGNVPIRGTRFYGFSNSTVALGALATAAAAWYGYNNYEF